MKPWIVPSSMDLSITKECNLSCQTCNLNPKEQAVAMDTPTILETISHLDDIHLHIIDVCGGEPLLRKEWLEITEYITCSTDLALVISTNGTLWNDSYIRRISDLPGDIMVAVSLDGSTPAHNGQIRAPGREKMWEKLYSDILTTIRGLVENNITMCVNFVLNSLNISDVFKVHSMLQDMGVAALNVIRFYPAGVGFTHRNILDVSYESWAHFVQELADHCQTCNEFGNITVLTHFWEIFLPLCEVYGRKKALELTKKVAHPCSGPLDSQYRRDMTTVGCNAGITHGFIDFDGSFYPCGLIPRYEEVNCGNITEKGFDDIWFNSPVITRIRSHHAEAIPGCSHCEYLDICGGGCRGRALTLSGTFFGPDLSCPHCMKEGGS